MQPARPEQIDAGSSPLTRGKLSHETEVALQIRLIPAHAGKTLSACCLTPMTRAHPRSRGENTWLLPRGQRARGSSPLTRGKRCGLCPPGGGPRLIPAHAGKTCFGELVKLRGSAHPRSRGENHEPVGSSARDEGSSPLTRGKHGPPRTVCRRARLIPAHAGKTNRPALRGKSSGAHPRSRGENRYHPVGGPPRTGSSPLTRGKPDLCICRLCGFRLIPAHAGKTLPDLRFYCADRSDLGNP